MDMSCTVTFEQASRQKQCIETIAQAASFGGATFPTSAPLHRCCTGAYGDQQVCVSLGGKLTRAKNTHPLQQQQQQQQRQQQQQWR